MTPPRFRQFAVIASLALALGGLWSLHFWGGASILAFEQFLRSYPVAAPAIYIVVHVIAAAAFLPCSALTLLAGVLWPQPYALGISTAGALCASCATFLLGRHLGHCMPMPAAVRDGIARHAHGFAGYGWKMVVLAHLNPVLPSSSLGYAFGLSSIRLPTYAGSALLSMLPLQLALVTIGASARASLMAGAQAATLFLLVSVAAFCLWLILKNVSRKWLNGKRTDNERSNSG